MNRALGFISAAMLCVAGLSGQYGVVTPAVLAEREAAAEVSYDVQLIVPQAAEPRFDASFDPTRIEEPATYDTTATDTATAVEPPPFDPTKIVEPEPAVNPAPPHKAAVDAVPGITVTKPSIIMLTTPGCIKCIRWWDGELTPSGTRTVSLRQQFKDKNWFVTSHTGSASRYPTFRVYDGKRWYTHVGFMTAADVRKMLSGEVSLQSKSPQVEVSWGSIPEYTINGVPWTLKSLRNHLYTHSNHSYSSGSLDHLTFEELRRLHNAEHKLGKMAVQNVQSSVGKAVSAAADDYCPTCPQQRQSQQYSPGIFRRWGR